mmetsp:Transcript_18918/g.38163  ORF Transcript_18918/g.38163 Transcript_18918/m.38163 type:complete len:84 (+) Transcript_18918:633-884(+)
MIFLAFDTAVFSRFAGGACFQFYLVDFLCVMPQAAQHAIVLLSASAEFALIVNDTSCSATVSHRPPQLSTQGHMNMPPSLATC